ncbi:MAG TPA: thiol reductant ABC exporter subunit CydC [Anaerolineaceae bacterium]|nr:thiol reductant ABC exporter subunit CydC [Anaerolineaceae bacterium]HQH34775.1 thiol reductant ABC exporter subunit CydC [Anaerolineaceae bacterium]HQJ02748.1 thiol reductant ABC exporter subunit CydC [Anaerolineaceae bacterium]
MKPLRGWILISTMTGFSTVAAGVGLLGTSAYLIASAAFHPSIAELSVAVVGVRFLGISRGVFRYLDRLVSHHVNFRLLSILRIWFYDCLKLLAPARLIHYQRGDLLSRAIGDIDTLDQFYVRAVSPVISAIFATVGFSMLVGSWNVRLGWILAAGLSVTSFVLPALVYIFSRGPAKQLVDQRAILSQTMLDTLRGAAEIIVFQQQEEELTQINRVSLQTNRAQVGLAHSQGLSNGMNAVLTQGTVVLMLLVGIPLVRTGELDGIMLAVIVLITMASFEISIPIAQAAQFWESSLQAARRLFEMADQQPAIIEPVIPVSVPEKPNILIRNLSFQYHGNLPLAADHLNIDIPYGRKIALVGENGSGKTTILNLLMRFWDCQPGEILIDGIPVQEFSPKELRQRIGYVSPGGAIFQTTLRQNLLLANPGALDADLLRVLDSVQLGEWVQTLPDGLDTWLGASGLTISGGQLQRIQLARGLLMDAPIYLLDEPTTHLDVETENRLISLFRSIFQNRSLVWVTHRLVGLDWLDEILVLDNGRVVERGNQHTLLESRGRFYQLWEIQNRLSLSE